MFEENFVSRKFVRILSAIALVSSAIVPDSGTNSFESGAMAPDSSTNAIAEALESNLHK